MRTERRDRWRTPARRDAPAVRVEQVGFRVVAAGLTYSVINREQAETDRYALDDVQKMFMKLA